QFSPGTWRSHGGGEFAPVANMASREQQIAVAERVLASQGRGAWPVCGTGLSSATQRTVAATSAPDAQLEDAALNADAPAAPVDAPLPDAPAAAPAPVEEVALPAPEAPPAPAESVVVDAAAPVDGLAPAPPAVDESATIQQASLEVPATPGPVQGEEATYMTNLMAAIKNHDITLNDAIMGLAPDAPA